MTELLLPDRMAGAAYQRMVRRSFCEMFLARSAVETGWRSPRVLIGEIVSEIGLRESASQRRLDEVCCASTILPTGGNSQATCK